MPAAGRRALLKVSMDGKQGGATRSYRLNPNNSDTNEERCPVRPDE